MLSIASVCLDLFLIGGEYARQGRAGDGYGFEAVVAEHLARHGVPVRGDGAVRTVGPQSLSGLYHQIDAQGAASDALLIGEWKAYRGTIPKNELLRFHAVTEDYWLKNPSASGRPVFRIFGGTGRVTPASRRFAARWGIGLITPDTWPALALADELTAWPESDGPSARDRRSLAWLARPIQTVYRACENGATMLPPPPDDADLEARLSLQDRWSQEAWSWWLDSRPDRLNALVEQRGVNAA